MRSVMKVWVLAMVLMFFVAGFSMAQSNQDVDHLLDQDRTTFADAAYFVLLASGHAREDETPLDVFARMDWSEWGLGPKSPGDPISFGQFSFLLMQAFDLQGGVMYRLAPGPRYAAREIVYRGHTRGTQASSRAVPGDEVLRVLGSVLRTIRET